MTKITKAKMHLTPEQIELKIKETTGFWQVRRWLVILHATIEPSTAEQIANRFNLKKQTVSNLISKYNRQGPKALETTRTTQRQKAYLTLQEEKEFLAQFNQEAEKGYLTTTRDIHNALEKRLGYKIHISTTYRLLHRHGWRKVQPRPTHIKSDKQTQEEFKKKLLSKKLKK